MAMNISSLFSATQYSYLFNNSTANKNQTAGQKSINSLWSNYSANVSNNSAMTALAGLSEIKAGVASVMESYDTAKTTFYDEFDEAMEDLSKSAKAAKEFDFAAVTAKPENSDTEVADAITKTTTTDENGKTTTTTTYSDKMKDALKAVQNLVDDYNSATKFLSDNSSVSNRVSQLAKTFSDSTYRAADYSSIGINVKSDGTLEVDEEKLANTIVNDPNKVSRLVGSDGLAAKAESHVSSANSRRDSLFPSAKSMLGDQLSTAALYTGGTYAKMASIANVGNLVNMMF